MIINWDKLTLEKNFMIINWGILTLEKNYDN